MVRVHCETTVSYLALNEVGVGNYFVGQFHRYDGFFFLSAFKAEMALTEPNRTLAVTVILRGLSEVSL